MTDKAVCEVCFRRCAIPEGGTGFCGARVCRDGSIVADNYGRITAMALDPIEKKPLRRFHPGSMILSVGSYGCNLRCPFCQNNSISWSEEAFSMKERAPQITPEQLAEQALQLKDAGNIGVAFTYNEPLVGYEFVRDAARLIRKQGMVNVMVTNGTARQDVLEELLPYVDAMNIDLKCFSGARCEEVLGGDLQMVQAFIRRAARDCHVELTTLIVPGLNDSEEEMREMSGWIAKIDPQIPLHVSRFFPQFRMTDRPPTEVETVYRLAGIAGEKLRYVYTGNC